jgi:hypothetical protein
VNAFAQRRTLALEHAVVRQEPNVGRTLVLASIALLVVIRFFTEGVHLLPGMTKIVDVPLLLVLVLAALMQPAVRERAAGPYFAPALLFLGACTIAVLANPTRVALGPVALFLYGFLGPLVFYWAAHRLWPAGSARSLSKLLVALGIVQFLVVALVDVPRFMRTANPDVISGTFGENAYQLVFFLLVFGALVAGIGAFEPTRPAARFAVPLIACALVVVFLAQYRALLLAAVIVILLVGLALATAQGSARRRGAGLAFTLLVVLVATLAFVAVKFPTTKILPYAQQIQQNPAFFVSTRVSAVGGAMELASDEPRSLVVGTGPGTFSSRAWQTFANTYTPRTLVDPVARAVTSLSGAQNYGTDVSDRYTLPKLLYADSVLGSKSINFPFSSYSSLMAEVGVVGLLAMLWIYFGALARSTRMTLSSIRHARRNDPLPPLLLAAAIGLLVLLQMALFGNWLEVLRLTAPTWMLLAVGTKEFEARRQV